MTDMLIRILIGGLGVLLFFLGVAMLVVRGIAGSLRSIFAPRVIIIQNDSAHERQPGLTETYKPMVTAFIWLILLRRYALRDDQWDRIQDILPGREGHVGGTAADNRLFVEAVLFRFRAGIPWRDLPERFGDWKIVYQRFNR